MRWQLGASGGRRAHRRNRTSERALPELVSAAWYDTHAAAGNYYRKWVVKLVALPTHQGPDVATEALAPFSVVPRASTFILCSPGLYRDFAK